MLKKLPLALSVLALMMLLIDCRCQRRQILVRSVLLEIPTSVAGFSEKIDREKISDLVRRIIDKNPNFHFDARREDGGILHLTFIVPNEVSRNSAILLAGYLEGGGQDTKKSSIKAFADIMVKDGRIDGHEVSEGITRLLENIYNLRSGGPSDNQGFLKKIEQAANGESVAPGELINAINVLGEIREQQAIRPLIELLGKTDNLAVGNACLIALGELGSASSIPAIIEFVERKPPIIRRQAIIAARKIASKAAAEWLLVMAYGYDDPIVRKEALAALTEVEEKLKLGAD